MEEKTNEIIYFIRSFFSFWNSYKFFSFKSFNSSNNGFTLIEVLVVIAVIGILAAASLAYINPIAQMQKARDNERMADLKQIQTALELYRADTGEYPAEGALPSENDKWTDTSSGTTYINRMPGDPGDGAYIYELDGNGGYILSACTERLEHDNNDDVYSDSACGDTGSEIRFYSP